MYKHKKTTELSATDCRRLKEATVHARELGHPLNCLVTLAPYHASLPTPAARSADLNRLLSHLRARLSRWGIPWFGIWVWHSDETGRNPHVHVFLHFPVKHRPALRLALMDIYPGRTIDVSAGDDIRKRHTSGYWGSTLDYLCRFKSQQAYRADGGRAWRASVRDKNGRHVGIKSPITGKRWGSSRNLAQRAINEHWAARTARPPLTDSTAQKQREAA